MEIFCNCCGDVFTPSKETEQLISDGEIQVGDCLCEECLEMQNGYEHPNSPSDADIGL